MSQELPIKIIKIKRQKFKHVLNFSGRHLKTGPLLRSKINLTKNEKILRPLYAVAILSISLCTDTFAQKNWLDESFGRKGILRYDDLTLTKDFDEAAAVYQEDKLLVLGVDTSNRANGFTMVRLTNDGSPDYSFIPRRIIETDSTDYYTQILVTSDKKLFFLE